MDGTLVKVVVAGVLGAHGIGHVLGWMPAARVARFDGTSSGSWLLAAAGRRRDPGRWPSGCSSSRRPGSSRRRSACCWASRGGGPSPSASAAVSLAGRPRSTRRPSRPGRRSARWP